MHSNCFRLRVISDSSLLINCVRLIILLMEMSMKMVAAMKSGSNGGIWAMSHQNNGMTEDVAEGNSSTSSVTHR